MSRPLWTVAAVTGVTLLVASACVPTGPRPSLGEEVASASQVATGDTGIPEVDAILDRLDAVGGRTFTANYRITQKFGSNTADAAVAQAPPRRTVRIGSTVFLTGEQVEDQTCSTEDNLCRPGIIEQRVSDLGVGSGFYGPNPAQMLRVATDRRAGLPTASTREIANVTADCVSVPVGAGTETYCVSPEGPVALVGTAAQLVELQAITDTADPDALAPAPGP
jgi:hypothetical protein